MLTRNSSGDNNYTSLKGVDFGAADAKTVEILAESGSGIGTVEGYIDKNRQRNWWQPALYPRLVVGTTGSKLYDFY